jgi:hypothetical protein
MESDLGNPIEYNADLDPLVQEEGITEPLTDQSPQQYYYQSPPPYFEEEKESYDPFKNIPKSTWIIAFAVFLLGFFMGKTMQPVILRYA